MKISFVRCATGAGSESISIGEVCYYSDFRLAIGPWVVRVLSTIAATGKTPYTYPYLKQSPTTFRRA